MLHESHGELCRTCETPFDPLEIFQQKPQVEPTNRKKISNICWVLKPPWNFRLTKMVGFGWLEGNALSFQSIDFVGNRHETLRFAWDAWKKYTPKNIPQWWWKMVIYHNTKKQKSPKKQIQVLESASKQWDGSSDAFFCPVEQPYTLGI